MEKSREKRPAGKEEGSQRAFKNSLEFQMGLLECEGKKAGNVIEKKTSAVLAKSGMGQEKSYSSGPNRRIAPHRRFPQFSHIRTRRTANIERR